MAETERGFTLTDASWEGDVAAGEAEHRPAVLDLNIYTPKYTLKYTPKYASKAKMVSAVLGRPPPLVCVVADVGLMHLWWDGFCLAVFSRVW